MTSYVPPQVAQALKNPPKSQGRVGYVLRTFRKITRINRQEMADACGLTLFKLENLENNKTPLNFEVANRLAEFMALTQNRTYRSMLNDDKAINDYLRKYYLKHLLIAGAMDTKTVPIFHLTDKQKLLIATLALCQIPNEIQKSLSKMVDLLPVNDAFFQN